MTMQFGNEKRLEVNRGVNLYQASTIPCGRYMVVVVSLQSIGNNVMKQVQKGNLNESVLGRTAPRLSRPAPPDDALSLKFNNHIAVQPCIPPGYWVPWGSLIPLDSAKG